MGFKFNETMKGIYTLNNNEKLERSFHFDISFEASSVIEFMKDFKTQAYGTITMAGIATEKSTWGTLEIAIPTKKKLIYDLSFAGNDGEIYRLVGIKNIEYLKILSTMTHGQIELFKNDKSIGKGRMFFDLKDLPSFLLGMRYV